MRTFTEVRIALGVILPIDIVSKEEKRMTAQQQNCQKAGSGRRSTCGFGISRSRLGRLSVRFDGGPCYPEMVAALKEMVDDYGNLVKRGERLLGNRMASTY